jgi:hypothetical protein
MQHLFDLDNGAYDEKETNGETCILELVIWRGEQCIERRLFNLLMFNTCWLLVVSY